MEARADRKARIDVVFLALILIYVAIIAAKIARIDRQISELAAEDDE